MNRRQDRDRRLGDVYACEHFRALGNARQARRQRLRRQMVEMQEDMIAALTNTASLADLHRHGAADNVT